MIKDKLLKKEPIIYRSLENDLKDHKLAHSYLFCGEKSLFKKEVAILFAQSIIEGNDDFGCEKCDTCLRIKEGNHLDVLYLDGNKESIKVNDVEEMMATLYKTSLEKTINKVYIIDNINAATTQALNKILKFMEEPSNDHTFGIFISDDVNSLLDTIKSRCKRVEFKSVDYNDIKEQYLNDGIDLDDSYLLSEILHEYKEIDDSYLIGKDYVYKTIDYLSDPEYIEIFMVSEVYPLKDFKEVSNYYLKIMTKVLDDSISGNYLNEDKYDNLLEKVKDDAIGLLEIFLKASETIDNCVGIDRKLLFDQICYKIIEYKKKVTYGK